MSIKKLSEKFQIILNKQAAHINPWMAGFEHGEEDTQLNQWGDPRASWGAWRAYLKDKGLWQDLDNSYDEYKAGYIKALLMNKGQGMAPDPDDQQVWEEPNHPWGYNRTKIKPEFRKQLDEMEPIPSAKEILRNRG